ncbi:phage/plasmid replication protein, II/X family [Moraxella nasibovis]|uniref:phage/plasmid replication protein, II/X family n=1 Tax=Moraxella nasibovis TaxID=2904120 RepID=UPI0024108185|nr:phage/plasmid replication protein, II/X family [Moraxella nasibovis]WFF39695.1 phage/plasmid replication protein, II/X family [Moraxella nasibovis]WFF39696.1 phage/plasmid replication protein, II/X family [Moraxella nasibovis]WFF39697.1 phage/plasmid replication protein, II/X family [Moraxella nasibovis]
MLDHLRLAVPVFPIYAVECGQGNFYFEGDLLKLGLNCGARVVTLGDDGKPKAQDLYAPYDTLGSDYSDMAVKFYDKGINCLPYVELKASPLKLLQGHNVYGFESIELGAVQMLGMLIDAFPDLCAYLDFAKTEVLHLDITYMASLPHQNLVKPVLEYLANISSGHAKAQNLRYNNYVRWGTQNSRYIGRKVYGKYEEVENQIKQLQKQAGKDNQALAKLNALFKAKDFANAKLRFEARICKTYLSKNNYPSNLFELIHLQKTQYGLLQNMWGVAFSPILNALQGENMTLNDDDKVLDLLKSKLFTVNKKGVVSYTKANNAYQFYIRLKNDGFEKTKQNSSKSTFHLNLKILIDCGLSKAYLQNLHNEPSNVIPFVRLIHIDFDKQVPDDYVEPISKYQMPLVA